jgi:hypothetical protein
VAFKTSLRLSAVFGRGVDKGERNCQKEKQAYNHHLSGVIFHVTILPDELLMKTGNRPILSFPIRKGTDKFTFRLVINRLIALFRQKKLFSKRKETLTRAS